MTHEQILDLIFGANTLEEIRLAKAAQAKYLRENSQEELGSWQLLEAGEMLFMSEESLIAAGKTLSRNVKSWEKEEEWRQTKYSELKGKRARKEFRRRVNTWYRYRELCREAEKYVG